MNREVNIDLRCLREKETAHTYLAEVLGFPEYYGRNLDALYDCLQEMNDCCLLLEHKDEASLYGTYGEKILRVIKEAAKENPALTFLELPPE